MESASRITRPCSRCRVLSGWLLSLWALGLGLAAWSPVAAEPSGVEVEVGEPLTEVLDRWRAAGLAIVFSERVVHPKLRVVAPPSATTPQEMLEEILAPHGLGTRRGPRGSILIVPASSPPSDPAVPGRPAVDLPVTRASIDVVASRPWVLGEGPSSLALDRADLLALPQVGEDVFRGLAMLPGTTASDASARLVVRGGGVDEVLVRLDGVEIVEPYHLEDFNDALGILAPQIIDRVELLTGGFPARYGDRLSGVLELTTLGPAWRRRIELGVDLLEFRAAGSGTSADGASAWLSSVRAGSLEIPFRFADVEERPTFGDAYLKLESMPAEHCSWRVGVLAAGDRLRFAEVEAEGEVERFDTRYANFYGWWALAGVRGEDLVYDVRAWVARIDRDRQGLEREGGAGFELRDDRTSADVTLAFDGGWQKSPRTVLEWGVDVRQLDSDYDYRNSHQLDDVLASIRDRGRTSATAFSQRFRGHHVSAYASGRFEPTSRWLIEAGVRFDRNSVLDNDHVVSPRLSTRFALDPHRRFHASWGRYAQSQRLYELPVEDGRTAFQATEEADFWSLGYEHTWAGASTLGRRPLTARVELYQRRVENPRIRFENLFDPISKAPEIESDRVRLVPEQSLARGVEVFIGGAAGRRVDWFAALTRADAFDRIDGRDVPRAEHQKLAARLDVTVHLAHEIDAHVVWHHHTGWPTTRLDARLSQGPGGEPEIQPLLGPLRGERLPEYRRLDARVSRQWSTAHGRLNAYLEVQNLLGRRNTRGFEPSFEITPDGEVDVRLERLSWGRRVPSIGIRWSF